MERCTDSRNSQAPPLDPAAPLLVPGDRPDRARTAAQRGARTLVPDLEDAVAPERKAARAAVVETVRQLGGRAACLVRVNAADDPAVQAADLAEHVAASVSP